MDILSMDKLRSGSEYIPLADDGMSRARVVISFAKVAWLAVALPFLAFTFCITWSILYNFEHSTFTHCQVYNFLPSVSAAIGHYKPQRNVWKTAITLQATVRILVCRLYYHYYKENVYKWAQRLSNIALTMYIVENVSLVTLSFWSSDENYAFHKMSFITFLITSFIHMLLMYYIMRNCRNITKDWSDVTSMKWKQISMMLNVFCTITASYFFYRHNTYCEPFVYSMFALSEYGVVLSNMGFHMTAAFDFATTRLMISGNGLRII